MMHLPSRLLIARLSIALAAAVAAGAAHAQAFPVKPMRAITGFPPGGFTDLSLRKIAGALNLPQTMLVENRPGAGTMIAVQAVVDAPPDGYTLGFASAALGQNQTQMKTWTIDPIKQLAPISAAISVPILLYVNPSKQNVRSMEEFIARARTAANPVVFASSGGSDVLPTEHLKSLAGIKMDIVNFNGTGNVIAAMTRGDADISSSNLLSLRGQFQSGQFRAVVIGGSKRHPMYPDLPSADEVGLKGYDAGTWSGFVAPAGTQREVVLTLNRAIVAALKNPEVSKWVLDGGNVILASTPEEFRQMIASDIAKWNQVAKQAGVTPQ